MGRPTKRITPKQQHFADEWLVDHNGMRAYKVAYSSVKKDTTAKVNASRLLTNANVKAYIDSCQSEIASKYEVTHQRAIKEESALAFSDITEIFNGTTVLTPNEIPAHLKPAISSIEIKELPDGSREYKYRLWDKGQALKRVGQYLGLYEKDNKQKGPPLKELFDFIAIENPELADAMKAHWEKNVSD